MDKSKMTEHIKVNLPLTEQDYLSGNGEGVWMLVDRETKMAHDIDAVGGRYVGILDNDSVYYPGLNAGAEIIFEMRGEFRPVAILEGTLAEHPRLTPAAKAAVLQKIAERQRAAEGA